MMLHRPFVLLKEKLLLSVACLKESSQQVFERVESTSAGRRKKSMSWLLRGYVKGGFILDASETLIQMLDMGLFPDYLDRAAVLTALRRNIQESGNLESYLKLCKRLSETDLIGPCIVYLYVRKFKLWMAHML